ncbi:hypothetical protein J6590_042485 [Homalodisca vitripennis]|nr:hypothetical protein J6590_042485 [Homalodisca vitripennis]
MYPTNARLSGSTLVSKHFHAPSGDHEPRGCGRPGRCLMSLYKHKQHIQPGRYVYDMDVILARYRCPRTIPEASTVETPETPQVLDEPAEEASVEPTLTEDKDWGLQSSFSKSKYILAMKKHAQNTPD